MRWGLIIWCVLGAGLIGLKAHLDVSAGKYPDVALRAGNGVYLVPRVLVTNNDGWRADLQRLAGCWDAREGGVVQAAASIAGCNAPRALHLDLTRLSQTIDGDHVPDGAPAETALWANYAPPAEHLRELGRVPGGGHVVVRSDWQLFGLAVPGSPWVYMLTAGPKGNFASVYAGRCFKPEANSDLGMSCTFVTRLGEGVAVEYFVGADDIGEFPATRDRLVTLIKGWHR